MNTELTPAGYEQTREKLQNLERRLLRLEHRSDLSERHKLESRRSYQQMMYLREIKLYEAEHPEIAERR
jgi:hypothetical protein